MIESMPLPVAPLRDEELSALLGHPHERRDEPRHPLFCPVTLRTSECPTHLLSGFSREVSLGGIGLLHGTPIKQGATAVITVVTPEAHLSKSAVAVWSRPAGEGWFLSGWQFVSAK